MTILEEKRKAMHLLQKDVAEQLGISQATYCLYETGMRSIPHTILLDLKSVLNLSEDEVEKNFLPNKFTICK